MHQVVPSRNSVRCERLTVPELSAARIRLCKLAQEQMFQGELERLSYGRPLRADSSLRALNPVLCDGLLVVQGRTTTTTDEDDQHGQIILPTRHDVTRLVIEQYHAAEAHAGARHTLAAIRSRYWILHGLSAVKSVLSRCTLCRRHKAPMQTQQMAPLRPEQVIGGQPPFTNVGVDFFGPFTVTIGRNRREQQYGCLFTCLACRAVHIEVTHSMDTDSFLLAFTRFVARRGPVQAVFSDNGSNLRRGEAVLRDAIRSLDHDKIDRHTTDREVAWHFNPPYAHHMGGAWERLIRSVRDVLKIVLHAQPLRDELLCTVMTEAERVVNSRPLTTISTDPRDGDVLTPSMLLTLKQGSCNPPGIFAPDGRYPERRWRQAHHLANVFWTRWSREYVRGLQQRDKWQRPVADLKPGDICVMQDVKLPRGQWPLAKVLRVEPSRDGLVRKCTVRSRGKDYVRPIHTLAILERSAREP